MKHLFDAISTSEPSFWESAWTRRPWVGYCVVEVESLLRELMVDFDRHVRFAATNHPDELSGDGQKFWFLRRVERYYGTLSDSVEHFKSLLAWPAIDASIIHNTSASTTGAHFDNAHTFIVQLSGTKRLRIWSPDNISEAARHARLTGVADVGATALPSDSARASDTVLRPGDVAYVPVYWGHRADTGASATTLSFGVRMRPASPAPTPTLNPREQRTRPEPAVIASSAGALVQDPSELMAAISSRTAESIELLIQRMTNLGPALGVDFLRLVETWEQTRLSWSALAPSARLVESIDRALPQVRVGRWGSLGDDITELTAELADLRPYQLDFLVVLDARHDVAAPPESAASVKSGLRLLATRNPAVMADVAHFVERVVVSDNPAVLGAAARRFRTVAIPHRCLDRHDEVAAYWSGALGEVCIRLRLWGRPEVLAGDPALPAGSSLSDIAVVEARREAVRTLLPREKTAAHPDGHRAEALQTT